MQDLLTEGNASCYWDRQMNIVSIIHITLKTNGLKMGILDNIYTMTRNVP